MIKLELTKDEAQAAIKLLDLAIKAGGLNVSEAALVIAKKINEAALRQNQDDELPPGIPRIPQTAQ